MSRNNFVVNLIEVGSWYFRCSTLNLNLNALMCNHTFYGLKFIIYLAPTKWNKYFQEHQK